MPVMSLSCMACLRSGKSRFAESGYPEGEVVRASVKGISQSAIRLRDQAVSQVADCAIKRIGSPDGRRASEEM